MDDERVLIEQAQSGDQAAFLTLLSRYDRQIMSVVYRFTYDLYDREDLYQEIFLNCYRSIKRFRFRSSFSTWLYRIALNRCLTYMRKKKPTTEMVETPSPPLDWDRRERLMAIRRAMSRLRGQQKICFHLHYIEDWGTAQIAELIGRSEGTVKSHLNRARAKIRTDREVLVWQTNP
jgi:RNA polymerase sigma-70 factor (ECF subfamily)